MLPIRKKSYERGYLLSLQKKLCLACIEHFGYCRALFMSVLQFILCLLVGISDSVRLTDFFSAALDL